MKHINQILIAISVVVSLTACGGGGDATAPEETTTTAGAAGGTTGGAITGGAATTTTPTTVSLNAGTYTGNVSKSVGVLFPTKTYSGTMNITLTPSTAGSYAVSGNWNVNRLDSLNHIESTTNDLITGTANDDGAFSATGNSKVLSMTGTVVHDNGKITGTYTYVGEAGNFTGNFTVFK